MYDANTRPRSKDLGELLTGLDVRAIPSPPERNIVLVPTAIYLKAKRLRDVGKAAEALKLLERNVWAKVY